MTRRARHRGLAFAALVLAVWLGILGVWVMADEGDGCATWSADPAAPRAAAAPPIESEFRPVETDLGPMITR